MDDDPYSYFTWAVSSDLKRWQVLAAADGWPDKTAFVPLGEAADQMWTTRHIGEDSKNTYSHEPQTVELTIVGPPRRDPFDDPSPLSIDKAPIGYDEFFAAHDDCDVWKVTAPADVYVTYPLYSSAVVIGHVDRLSVAQDELSMLQERQRGGPVEGWVGQYDTPDRAVTFESDRHLHFLPLATSARAAIGGRGVDVIRIDAGVIHEFQSAGFA